MKDFEWIYKSAQRVSDPSYDVCITKIKGNDRRPWETSIRFMNNSYKKITTTGFLVVALSSNRMYFREESRSNGYKLTNPTRHNTSWGITLPIFNENFVGEFNLCFDKDANLFYIEF